MRSDGRVDRRRLMGGMVLTMAAAACARAAGSGIPGDVRNFGAKGDGVADDTLAIQRAIDAAAREGGGTVTLSPGTFLLRYRPSEDGDGVSALTLRSGVTIEGMDRARCILKLADGQYGPGTYARMIASKGEIARAALRSFTIDGSRPAQGQFRDDVSGAAILLGWKGRCVDVAVEDLAIRDMIGQGIMLQGTVGNVSQRLRITNNRVERTSYIGIQSSQFDGLQITNNRVFDCQDNGIDIYGDDTIGHSTIVTSRHATITDNQIRNCGIGVFLETVADCITANNEIADCRVSGVRVNRIHGEPRNLTIEHNRINDTPVGVAIGGDTGGVIIRDNDIRGFTTAGLEFSYNVSRVTATANRFLPADPSVPIVLGKPTTLGATPEEQLSFVRIRGNRIPRGHDPERIFVNRYRRVVDVDVGEFANE